jgi:hypothetical protein
VARVELFKRFIVYFGLFKVLLEVIDIGYGQGGLDGLPRMRVLGSDFVVPSQSLIVAFHLLILPSKFKGSLWSGVIDITRGTTHHH